MKNNFELTMAAKKLISNYLNELAILSDENTLDLLKEQISTNLKSIGLKGSDEQVETIIKAIGDRKINANEINDINKLCIILIRENKV